MPTTREFKNQEQLLRILSEIDEARAEIRNLLNDFPRALKRWADAEKMMGEHYYKLAEIIVDLHSGPFDEARFAQVISATGVSPDTDGAWQQLTDLGERWDAAITRIAQACGRYVAFSSYEEMVGMRDKRITSVLTPYVRD